MNRSDFFKVLGFGTAGLVIPNTTWSQKPIKIYDNYINGFVCKITNNQGNNLITKTFGVNLHH
jgi:hypothetical protein